MSGSSLGFGTQLLCTAGLAMARMAASCTSLALVIARITPVVTAFKTLQEALQLATKFKIVGCFTAVAAVESTSEVN